MQLSTNTLLQGGKYRIERVLGQGGFGITYLGIQVALGRTVAIKEFFMKEYCNRDASTSCVSVGSEGSKDTVERFRQKFVKEAQTIANLNHPNIIRIYDVFEENGTAYYVMEYLGEGSLSDYQKKRGALSEAESLRFIRQVADALKYIHERKINHLDVKPGNILLNEKHDAVLIDFGLSKRYDEEGNQTSTTPVGISHGYAPLEQYKKGGVGTFSPATDIYSLGATLYRLLTGVTPPDADVISDDGLPPLPEGISSAVVSAIEQAMQPGRKKRPQSIDEFLTLLDNEPTEVVPENEGKTEYDSINSETSHVAESVVLSQPPVSASSPIKKKWWLVMLAFCFVTILGIVLRSQKDNSNSGGEQPIKVSTDTVPVNFPAVTDVIEPAKPTTSKLFVATSPDGATVVIDDKRIGNTPIRDKDVACGQHIIKITKEGYEPVTKKINFDNSPVVLNEMLTEKVKLINQSSASSSIPAKEESAVTRGTTSKLFVTTTPVGALVIIDDKEVGSAPVKGKDIACGEHTVKIIKDGYESFSKKINFDDDPVVLNEVLTEKAKPVNQSATSSSTPAQETLSVTTGTIDDYEDEYVFSVTITGTINGHEYVDLGLSVKWATCNIGASNPWDYGNYYAWGETTTKSEYTEANNVTHGKYLGNIAGNLHYDAARANWGGTWRLPTMNELDELKEKCKWARTRQNGYAGYKVIGPNDNSIFLPAAGVRGREKLDKLGCGCYWSSTPTIRDMAFGLHLFTNSDYGMKYPFYRSSGLSVRPVSE